MTMRDARRLYKRAVEPKPDFNPADWCYVQREMEQVVESKTDRKAAGAIIGEWAWLYHNISIRSATGLARHIRQTWAQMQEEKGRR